MAKFSFVKEPKDAKYVVTAFQTVGYISLLAMQYLEEKGAIRQIGFLDLNSGEQIAVVNNGEIGFPIRVLRGGDVIFITSQFPLPQKSVDGLVDAVFELCKKNSYKGIIALDGLAIDRAKTESDVYYVSTKNGVQPAGTKKLDEGAMIGLNAVLALRAKLENLPLTIVMAETHSEIPDGLAAAALIQVINSISGMNVDAQELVVEYKKTMAKIDSMLKKIATKPKEEQSSPEVYG
ncbi:MAG: PAC2 family protein [Candidatus Parvarchaeota archaeon]|nr:PAC2 family protein [Candidatus Parvarchaeota archaeon]MCL5101338.1 PAC2 family protein [Candidatus Parvarchaeota archaeon]